MLYMRAAFGPRSSSRRHDSAGQAEVRGGCSGGGRPKPSAIKSFRGAAIWPDVANGRRNVAADGPAKHMFMQAAMNTHLSQSTAAGALLGQQGISLAIGPAVADNDMSSAVADAAASGVVPAITGRENGANISPAIRKIATSLRMVISRFTTPKSHRW